MSSKSTRGREDGGKRKDKDQMDVEGALALDLAELEAMLAIDSEQVRYDEQVKGRDFRMEGCSKACSSVDACGNQFAMELNSGRKRSISQDEMKKRRRRRDAEGQASQKVEFPPLSLTDDKLERADSVNDDSIPTVSKNKKQRSDNTRFQDSVGLKPSLTLTTSPPKIDDSCSVFTKPTPPDDVKRRNPRVYSYSPISRTRLTVPKRQFSPEPARKTAKILIGPRRITETVHLSDLTKILCKVKAREFSLPFGFTLKYRKRFVDESKSETVSLNLHDGRDSDDVNSLHLSSENDVENESKKETSAVLDIAMNTEHIAISAQKEDEIGTSKSHNESKHRRGRKRLNVNSTARKISSANSIAETPVRYAVKEESPTPLNISISKTAKGKPRKRAALIKLKRGKPRKNFTFHIAVGENTPNSSLPKNVPLTLSSSETSLKDSNRESTPSASQSTAQVTNVSHSLCYSDDRGNETDEHDDSKIEILDSGTSMIFNNTDQAQTSGARKMDNIFDTVKDDYDDGERLHIVETGDEEDSCDTDNRLFEGKKEKDPDDIVTNVVTKLVEQVCTAHPLSVNLIMEPLRRPNTVTAEESRRVPPLRIRIPQRREPRQRRPARVHDYSPPLPVSRIHRFEETLKKRTGVTSAESSKDVASEAKQKKSTGNKEDQKKCSLSNKETDTNPRSRKSSALSNPDCILPPSPVLIGSNHEEDIIATPSAVHEGFSDVNPSPLPSSEHPQECRSTNLDAACKGGHECELTGRSTRKRPISYEQLYPSLFSRRRKSNIVKTPAVTQLNVFDSVESDGAVKLKSGAENRDAVSSGCLKQKRRRRQNSITDSKHADDKLQQSFGEQLELDTSIYDSEEGKDQINSYPRSSNLTHYDDGSYDGGRKKASTDVIKVESTGNAAEEVHHSGEKTRRPSNCSMRDGRVPSISEGPEQDITISSTSTRRRRVRLDSEGTNELSSNLSQSVSKGRRKSSVSVDVDTAKSEGNEFHASTRLRNKRIDSKPASDKTKQKVSYQNMPYFKRIAQRRKLNPLAIGLKSRSGDDNPSFFYREILLRGDDLKKEDGADVIVDVDSELAVEGDDEAPSGRLSISVAFEINKIVPRPEMDNDDELKIENDGYLLTLDNVKTIFTNEVLDRKRLLNDMLTVVSAQYCSEISSQNVFGGASIRYNTMVKNAHRLRDKILLFTKDQRENAKWAHQTLLKHLAVPMLATYIDLLRFCKTIGRYLLDFILEQSDTDKVLNKMNACIQDFISEKVLDPQTVAICKTLTKRHAKNICLLTVSPTFTHAEYRSRSRSHEYMFRVLLPNVADRVEPVRLNLPATQDISICEAVDHCIRLVSRKVVEVHRKYPDLKIVLVGWGTSCVINHQVVQCMPNVSAIINFAFPMKTADGPRGDVDDDILLTYCPTLFVVGDQATDCDIRELQVMATRMIAPTGVIVVGSSNYDLHPSTLRLTIERFTHRTVQRALLDDVVDFLQLYCSSSTTHSFRLHPLKLVEVNDVDLSVLRTSNLFSGSQTKSTKFGSTLKAGK
uniref:Bm4368 n=2 Tax=Wuchereria bancrofti TaxID=6293 RepID=A0AAF5PT77_WUCBA